MFCLFSLSGRFSLPSLQESLLFKTSFYINASAWHNKDKINSDPTSDGPQALALRFSWQILPCPEPLAQGTPPCFFPGSLGTISASTFMDPA